MSFTGRFEIRLPEEEFTTAKIAAAQAGVSMSEYARRAMRAFQGERVSVATRSEAEGATYREQAGPVPVLSGPLSGGPMSDGVRPAVSPRTPAPALGAADGELAKRTGDLGKPAGAPSAEARPPRRVPAPRRADVGPKPASASKPRPKASAKKVKP